LSRQKLIKQLKDKNPKLNNSELIDIIDVFSKNISDTLKSKNNTEIRGFGRLYCKKLKANYNARNPATNKLIYKPERVKVRFKPSKKLIKIINK